MDIDTARIVKGLISPDPYDQYFAMLTIEEDGRVDLLPRLMPLCRSPYADIRSMAVLTVGALDYVPALHELKRLAAEDSDKDVRQRAAKSARMISGELLPGDVAPDLLTILFDPYHHNVAA